MSYRIIAVGMVFSGLISIAAYVRWSVAEQMDAGTLALLTYAVTGSIAWLLQAFRKEK